MMGHVNAGQRICYLHLKITTSHNGLRTNLKIDQLLQRLQQIYTSRDRLSNFKTDVAIYTWFRKKNRSARPSNTLKPYRFQHSKSPTPKIPFEIIFTKYNPNVKSE